MMDTGFSVSHHFRSLSVQATDSWLCCILIRDTWETVRSQLMAQFLFNFLDLYYAAWVPSQGFRVGRFDFLIIQSSGRDLQQSPWSIL